MGHQLDKVNRIIATSQWGGESHGHLIVHTLLEGRSQEELNVDELKALAIGYNWWGGRAMEAYEAICLALEKQPNDRDLLAAAALYAQNLSFVTGFATHSRVDPYEDLIQRQLGPLWFWRIQRAREYEIRATGEDEEDFSWEQSRPLLYPEAMDQAFDELLKALDEGGKQAAEEVRQYIENGKEREALHLSPRFVSLMARLRLE